MSLQSRVEKLERAGMSPGPCWLCELVKVGNDVFFGRLKGRGVDPDACPAVTSPRFCPLCSREYGVNVAGWTEADFELERWYYLEVASLDAGRIDAARGRYLARLAEIGAVVYGEHYPEANAASDAAMSAWWESHRDEVSDEDLIAVTRNPAEHRMIR